MRIISASPSQMATFQRWATDEGWQPGDGDIAAFHQADPEGFLLGIDNHEPIATISLVRYSDAYAFLGFFIVSPAQRGRGWGRQIWDHALARFPTGTVGLDGVLDQIPSYEESGFVASHLTHRFSGPIGNVLARLEPQPHIGVADVNANSERFDELVDYDAAHVPERRRRFLQGWLAPDSPRHSVVALDNGAIVGWATARPALPSGVRVGPLFARDTAVALALLSAAISPWRRRQVDVAIDVPEVNQTAMAFTSDLGMAPGFATARMYRGPAPQFELNEVFGNTTLELG